MALVENPTKHFMVQSIVNASKRILGRPVKPNESLSIDIVQSIALFYFTSSQIFICIASGPCRLTQSRRTFKC